MSRTALTCPGSDGPRDKIRSSVLDPRLLGLHPISTDPRGDEKDSPTASLEATRTAESVNDQVSSCPSQALPPWGAQGTSCFLLMVPMDPAASTGSTCQPEHTQAKAGTPAKTPHEGTSSTHSAFSCFARINVPKPWPTKGTRLHRPDTKDQEFKQQRATRVIGKWQYSLSSPGQGMPGCSGMLGNTG